MCAKSYYKAVESFYRSEQYNIKALMRSIASIGGHQPSGKECIQIASSIADNHPQQKPSARIFLDVSATSRHDLKTGIERVARAFMLELINAPPKDYRVEPVYLTASDGRWHYRFAREFTFDLIDCPSKILADDPIDARPGDIVIALDYYAQGVVESESYLSRLYRDGVKIYFFVFDLLPILLIDVFPPDADQIHTKWLKTVTRYDGTICISGTVAAELSAWASEHGITKSRQSRISWLHLGADMHGSIPTLGLPADADMVLRKFSEKVSFLMVGTIEPRKDHLLVIRAFEVLWKEGLDVNLVIVGSEGWRGLPDEMRRTIPETVQLLRSHKEIQKHVIWLEGISDEYLEKIYASCNCLIAASKGEGFGLPLIEAAQHHLPIIARDIPVFREVAGEHAYYFDGTDPESLARSIVEWLRLYRSQQHPYSDDIHWLTWKQSANQLLNLLGLYQDITNSGDQSVNSEHSGEYVSVE